MKCHFLKGRRLVDDPKYQRTGCSSNEVRCSRNRLTGAATHAFQNQNRSVPGLLHALSLVFIRVLSLCLYQILGGARTDRTRAHEMRQLGSNAEALPGKEDTTTNNIELNKKKFAESTSRDADPTEYFRRRRASRAFKTRGQTRRTPMQAESQNDWQNWWPTRVAAEATKESSLTRTDSCSSRYRPSDVRDPKRQGFGPAMCVRHVDVRVICILHNDAQFAAFFVDPRAK